MPEIDWWESATPEQREERVRGLAPLWKVVWSNGDEAYVKAYSRNGAIDAAWLKHGPSTARIVYCDPYPAWE